MTKFFFGNLLTNTGTELLTNQVLLGNLLTVGHSFWIIFIVSQCNTIPVVPCEDVRDETEEEGDHEESHID
ncbi:hypothetical protein GCK72_014010 [Caenorhabditis remanei]|uniref:Uncharacterized protein n=1 Tax=Caenorhabditis remanei TaxID=31234 RepID=A0A6A5GSC3_CAERE|nr:hypothetical protein GCK72_014010 [Caenorhabditis remanei]KAF1757554.1 hypothetical protein GCK72_014010 [Caenorhabditis remanei]